MKVHVSHVPLWALLAVMTLLAWQGWHRPVLRVTAPALQQGQQQEVGEVVAGQRIKESAVGLGSGRDRITAPPAVVSAAEQQRAAASAAISAVIHRDRSAFTQTTRRRTRPAASRCSQTR
jgi:ABC-type phosphate transport system auxiliary subunit